MKVLNYFLLVLLILISLVAINNVPGSGNLETFYTQLFNLINQNNLYPWLDFFLKFSPGTSILLSYLSEVIIIDQVTLFYKQPLWIVVKVILYFFYILTWLSLLYLAKSNKQKIKFPLLKLSVIYFASITILVSSVGLTFFEIISAPALVISISYLMQKRLLLSALFYVLSLLFNLNLFVLAPAYLLVLFKEENNLSKLSKNISLLSFLSLPLIILSSIIISKVNNIFFLGSNLFLNPGSFPKLLSLPFEYVFKSGKMDNLGWSVTILSLAVILLSLTALFKGFFSRRKLSFLLILLPIVTYLSLVWVNSIIYLLLSLFVISFIYLVIRLKKVKPTPLIILKSMFALLMIATLFLPDFSTGNLLSLPLIAIVIFLFDSSAFNFLVMFNLNLLIFINLFAFYGISGVVSIRGQFFNFFQILFSSSLVLFIVWYLRLFLKADFFSKLILLERLYIPHLKWLVVFLMILINISLITADGSSDRVSWVQYSLASIQQPNPFAAQTLVDQRYPPLSTAILSLFANSWKNIIGSSSDYWIATKLSILVFYSLTVWLLFKFKNNLSGSLKPVDKLLIILTTFSLIVQTQGLADLNIQLIPTLFLAILLLFKKKYLLSGLLMGITISIKWQPMILLPLFAVTIFDFRQIVMSIKRSLIFALGFLPVPILVWVLVLINPGGKEAFERATDYLLHGAPMLSGQALNLNWIATYVMHIFEYRGVETLEHLGGLNRQIPTGIAPVFLQGILFLIVWALITFKYWLKQKKDIVNFLAASIMIFFSHHQLNKSAYEKHIFYVPMLMLFLYLVRPTIENRLLLILFDIMTVMNLIFFYGFTGPKDINRLFFGFDITIIFSIYYLIIFAWVLWKYFKNEIFVR